MKVITTDGYPRYKYPDGIESLEDFISMINSNRQPFIRMQQFDEDNCVYPFLVEEDVKIGYVNFMRISEIHEEEVTLLSRDEYDLRLEKCVRGKCIECVHYREDCADLLHGHRNMICLDGTCHGFMKKDAES